MVQQPTRSDLEHAFYRMLGRSDAARIEYGRANGGEQQHRHFRAMMRRNDAAARIHEAWKRCAL